MIFIFILIALSCIVAVPFIVPKQEDKQIVVILCILFALGNLMIVGGGYAIGLSKNYSLERLNYKITKIEHQEQYTRHETRTSTYTDGNGNVHTKIEHYTARYGPYWYTYDELGNQRSVRQSDYEKWKAAWQNERKTGTIKGTSVGFSDCKDGDTFQCEWSGAFETMYPSYHTQRYLNKIRPSQSIFKRGDIRDKTKQYPRPVDKDLGCIVCYDGTYTANAAEMLFMDRINAKLGVKYQVHCIIVVFGSDSNTDTVDDVLNYWGGCNKNELVVFVGIDPDRNIRWVRTESWCDNTEIHHRIDSALIGSSFSVENIGQTIAENITFWNRKSFKDFDYIQSDISLTVAVWILIFQIAGNAAGLVAVWRLLRA